MRLSPHATPSVQSPRPLGNLAFVRGSFPQVGLIRTPTEPLAPLRSSPTTEPSTLLRTLLPPCPASVLWPSQCPPLELLPSHEDDGFSCSLSKPASEFLPPVCRAPAGHIAGPCGGRPAPASPRSHHHAAVSTPFGSSRHVISGSLAFNSSALTGRSHSRAFSSDGHHQGTASSAAISPRHYRRSGTGCSSKKAQMASVAFSMPEGFPTIASGS